jgi:ParB-like chromosome segregation protein Spo0J
LFDSAGAEGTRANTRPRREQTTHGVWTDKHFLNRIKAQTARNQTDLSLAAHRPLKRFKAQAPVTQSTSVIAEDPTKNRASGKAQTKTHEESADQLEASTASVGVAASNPLEKGRQNQRANKRAEKAANKRHAFLQSVETTNALKTTQTLEATIDNELFGELKQRNVLPAASPTSSTMKQAPTSVGELAAH